MRQPDVVVVGAGPNGLAAAITVARAGRSVVVFERNETAGGGVRSGALTLPGFHHDLCSAVYPVAAASPFFRSLPLPDLGISWVHSPAALAHPFDDGTAAVLYRSLDATAASLGNEGRAYVDLFGPFVRDWSSVSALLAGSILWPRHPLAMTRLGLTALRSAAHVASRRLSGARSRALFAGIAAHAMLPLDRQTTAGVGLALGGLAHVVGWPIAAGGAQRIADALAAHLRSLGGDIVTGQMIHSLDELPDAKAVLCDVGPRMFARLAADRLPVRDRRRFATHRHHTAAFKVDWALSGPIPWTAAECRRAATVHLGGTVEEIARAEEDVWAGRPPNRPFVILAQPSLFDSGRAPAGRHTAWAYCHVPNASTADMLERIESQVERFAPGFRALVLARSVHDPAAIERENPNYVGGDITSGAHELMQIFGRQVWRGYDTPIDSVFLCSAATPPGVGVHGLCGYFAARRALRRVFGERVPVLNVD